MPAGLSLEGELRATGANQPNRAQPTGVTSWVVCLPCPKRAQKGAIWSQPPRPTTPLKPQQALPHRVPLGDLEAATPRTEGAPAPLWDHPTTPSSKGKALTSVVQVVVVLLVLYSQVCLAAQGAERQQPRAAAGDGRDAGRLQARGVRRQLDRGPVGGVGEVLSLELLLLQ